VVLGTAGASLAVSRLGDKAPDRPPIVFVVFDALPTSMLMTPGGQIDAERFPGFAALARDATWYRNATTVHDSTVKSIPAILDGRLPDNLRAPTIEDHPVNLFTLLGRDYRVWADEEGTRLCPEAVCGSATRSRLLELLHGRREQRFQAALSRIRPQLQGARPPLWYMHVLLPHEPLRFLPSGKVYEGGADPEPGLDGNESFDNEWLTLQAEQRHLLQLEYTDLLVQRLLARLRKTGLYDKAVIVVTADHGMSFRLKPTPAEPYRLGQIGWRRDLTRDNAQDVAFVPLFVKTPRQTGGIVDDAWVRTVDILPTLLKQARVKTRPRALAGRALGDSGRRPRALRVLTNRHGPIELDPAALTRERATTIARRAQRFGVGADVDRLFAIGPNAELIGRQTTSLATEPSTGGRRQIEAHMWGARRYLDVDRAGHQIPANVIGRLAGRAPGGRDLAVTVNGRVAAVGRSFTPIGALRMSFSLMVPESAFRDGFNDVRVYEVTGREQLTELGRSPRA
jgi:hypothetical protein